MPVATPEQYGQMLDRALAEGFAFPSINVTSSQTLNGILRGLADARSDGIVQISVGGARYLGGGDAVAGARAFAAMTREVAAGLDVLVAVHSDHAPPNSVDGFLRPLLAESPTSCGRPTCSVPASTGATCSPRRSATCTASTRPATPTSDRGSCATARRRSQRR